MVHVDYVSDVGVTYQVKMPQWVATLTGAAVGNANPPAPKGLRPRRRYYRHNDTGREGSFVVPAVTGAMYTDPFDTAVTVEAGVFGGAGIQATLQGATGERRKHI
jgi:hypothetical protein